MSTKVPTVTKSDFAERISEKFNLSHRKAEDIINYIVDTTIEEIKTGKRVRFAGFGTFSARERHSRGGVNPQKPNERIEIPAVIVPKFKAGKTMKDALKDAQLPKPGNVASTTPTSTATTEPAPMTAATSEDGSDWNQAA